MAYIGVSPSNGVRRVHTYTATASQTTFSGAGAEGTSLSYKDSNFVDVYQNGVKLGDADYTATSGTSIVLGTGATASDLVVIVVFDVFSVADTVSKADGGTFDGNITMAGTLTGTTATFSTADNNPQLILKSTDADADRGPVVQFTRDSASPADNDILGRVQFLFDNDAGETTTAVQIEASASDVSDGSEDASLNIVTMQSGATSSRMKVTSSETVFNDDSKDVDFRVESDGNGNMLVVDAGNNGVAIGGGVTSGYQLQINNASGSVQQLLSAGANFNSTIAFGDPDANTSGEIIYAHNGDSMRFHTSGTERLRIDSSGNFGVGLTSASATTGKMMHLDDEFFIGFGAGDGTRPDFQLGFQTATTTLDIRCGTGSDAADFRLSTGGLITSSPTAGNTTSSSANMVVTSGGEFAKSTSSKRYKNTINDATHGLTELLKLRSVTFKGNNDGDIVFGGLLAEEVHDAGLTEFVVYNDDDQPDALAYGNMVSLCIKAIQELSTKVTTLEAEVKALKGE